MITFSDLTSLLSEHFGIDESMLLPASTFEELEMDSLAVVETAVIVEEKFGVVVSEGGDGLGLSTTLAEAVDFLNRSKAVAALPTALPVGLPEQAAGNRAPCES